MTLPVTDWQLTSQGGNVWMRHDTQLYLVRDRGSLCLDCCVTLATTLLALDIL